MAGDWIKWTKGLARKPEVVQIAIRLGRSRHDVAGLLMELWEWADENVVLHLSGTEPDNCPGVVPFDGLPENLFLALTGVSGLADAMTAVGWLSCRNGHLTFPNYARHNGKTAKSRALDSSRKQQSRTLSAPRPPDVRDMSGLQPDKTRTREEKRREEERQEPPHPPMGAELAKPSKPRKPLQQPATVPIPPAIDTPEFRRVWTAWIAERTRQRKTLTESAAESQLASLAGIGTASAIECVQASITNQWQGLFPKKYQSDANKGFPTHDQKLIDVFNTVELPEEN